MPRPKKADARDTRTLALGAAHDLLHQHGYHGLSLDAVARRVGVRQASLYHHFPGGKDQLILEVARQAVERDAQGFGQAIGRHPTAQGRLRATARFILSGPGRTGRMVQEAMRFLDEAHQAQIYDAFYQGEYLALRRVFEDGVRSGELRPHDTARSTWAFLDLTEQLGANPAEASQTDLADWIVDLLLHGLAG